jgi:gliding motility-associated-like protein
MKFFLLTALLVVSSFYSTGQIIIDATPTPTDLVTNTLIGPGLTTSNITFNGSATQIGYFEANTSNIGLDSGVVMTSGDVTTIPFGPLSTTVGGPGDADVLATAQSVTSNPSAGQINSTFDAAVLEFDFVPTGDVVVFNFVFASDEYLTYVNTQYNDAFGFYISGPNPAGGNYNVDNLAIVPGTTEPITISTIHPGLNSQYYLGTPVGHDWNGFTIPIEIRFDVICDSTYHFKFAVADCQDGILDTGVFLEGGSFQAIPVDLSLETNVGAGQFGDSVIFEGCGTSADFIFTRPSCQSSDSLYVDVAIAGTATNGVDYGLIPDSVLFLPGETEVVIPFFANQDGVFEGYEDVILTVTNILPSGDTIVTTGTVWLLDNLNVEAVAHDTTTMCMMDSVLITGHAIDGVPPYSYTWNTAPNDTVQSAAMYVPGTPNGIYEYYLTVIDACGFEDTDTLTLEVAQTLFVDTTISSPASACLPDGWVSATVIGQTSAVGQPYYHWEGPGTSGTYQIDGTVMTDIPTGWYYFTVTDDVCTANDSAFVDVLNAPVADFSTSTNYGCAPLTVAFTNNSQNAVSFEWTFGNGDVQTVNNMNDQSAEYLMDATVMLVAYDAASCSDTAYATITVEPCGCTDPEADNYNPLATIEDGSCIYPIPTVSAPNIFTPNGDENNDLFYLKTSNSTEIELIILNRWGNVMFEATGPNPAWDGKARSGADAEEGTYFYKYIVTGVLPENQLEGHGFVQLQRD